MYAFIEYSAISIAIDDCLTSAIFYFSTLYISPYMYTIYDMCSPNQL